MTTHDLAFNELAPAYTTQQPLIKTVGCGKEGWECGWDSHDDALLHKPAKDNLARILLILLGQPDYHRVL